MSESGAKELLCQHLAAIREGNSRYRKGNKISQQKLADLINEIIRKKPNKYKKDDERERSFFKDLEDGKKSEAVTLKYADLYFEAFSITNESRMEILNSNKIVLIDSSALMNMPHILKTFGNEFYKIIICDFILEKLENYRNNKRNYSNAKKARKVFNELVDLADKVVYYECDMDVQKTIAEKIKDVALDCSNKYICNAVVISYDKTILSHFSGYEKSKIEVLSLDKYLAMRENVSQEHLDYLQKIRDEKSNFNDKIDLSKDEINSFFIDGRTLISACIVDELDEELKMQKIKWLIKNGADVNKTDNASDFFPPITTAVQKGNFKLVEFLLKECDADPNVGSRYPYNRGTIGIQNEGNMALMVAAHDDHPEIVELLCKHPKISINQQDRNGFTALMKACMQRNEECIMILKKYGADERILDSKQIDAKGHYDNAKPDIKRQIKMLEKERNRIDKQILKLKSQIVR